MVFHMWCLESHERRHLSLDRSSSSPSVNVVDRVISSLVIEGRYVQCLKADGHKTSGQLPYQVIAENVNLFQLLRCWFEAVLEVGTDQYELLFACYSVPHSRCT